MISALLFTNYFVILNEHIDKAIKDEKFEDIY